MLPTCHKVAVVAALVAALDGYPVRVDAAWHAPTHTRARSKEGQALTL